MDFELLIQNGRFEDEKPVSHSRKRTSKLSVVVRKRPLFEKEMVPSKFLKNSLEAKMTA